MNGVRLLAVVVLSAKGYMKNKLINTAILSLWIASFFIDTRQPGVQFAFVQAIIPIILGLVSAATAIGGAVSGGQAADQQAAAAAKDRAWRERQQKAEIELRKKQMAQQSQQTGLDMLQNQTNQNIQQNLLSSADRQEVSDKTASDLAKAFLSRR